MSISDKAPDTHKEVTRFYLPRIVRQSPHIHRAHIPEKRKLKPLEEFSELHG
jgi:hypothetical protein